MLSDGAMSNHITIWGLWQCPSRTQRGMKNKLKRSKWTQATSRLIDWLSFHHHSSFNRRQQSLSPRKPCGHRYWTVNFCLVFHFHPSGNLYVFFSFISLFFHSHSASSPLSHIATKTLTFICVPPLTPTSHILISFCAFQECPEAFPLPNSPWALASLVGY